MTFCTQKSTGIRDLSEWERFPSFMILFAFVLGFRVTTAIPMNGLINRQKKYGFDTCTSWLTCISILINGIWLYVPSRDKGIQWVCVGLILCSRHGITLNGRQVYWHSGGWWVALVFAVTFSYFWRNINGYAFPMVWSAKYICIYLSVPSVVDSSQYRLKGFSDTLEPGHPMLGVWLGRWVWFFPLNDCLLPLGALS